MGTLKGSVSLRFGTDRFFNAQKANILMSNDSPSRACLADFGFMTTAPDPSQLMTCSAQLKGGTLMFMSPELFVPSKFGFTESKSTPEADIYAFGLVIHQVCDHDCGYPPFTYIFQVLTGKLPFPGLGMADIALNVVQGIRPPKPENASVIGFSDSLWSFVQRCWDGEMELRPKVAEVVSELGRATADWNGVMPPCAQVESVTSASLEPVLDFTTHCRFLAPPSPRLCPLNNGTGGVPGSSSGVVPENSTWTVSTSSEFLSAPSVQLTEASSAGTPEVVIKSSSESELGFVVRDAVVNDDCNLRSIRQTKDNRVWAPNVRAPPFQGHSPNNTPPQTDFSIVHHLSKYHVICVIGF